MKDMEVSPPELMNILNKIISKRKISLVLQFHRWLFCGSVVITLMLTYLSDGDLKTDGFSIESCRSMVAVMDVSFSSSQSCRHGSARDQQMDLEPAGPARDPAMCFYLFIYSMVNADHYESKRQIIDIGSYSCTM